MAVTVYTMPSCSACDATKKWLEKRGIPYETASLAKSPEALELAARHRLLAAPVVVAGAQCWSGFRPDLIDAIEYLTPGA